MTDNEKRLFHLIVTFGERVVEISQCQIDLAKVVYSLPQVPEAVRRSVSELAQRAEADSLVWRNALEKCRSETL